MASWRICGSAPAIRRTPTRCPLFCVGILSQTNERSAEAVRIINILLERRTGRDIRFSKTTYTNKEVKGNAYNHTFYQEL